MYDAPDLVQACLDLGVSGYLHKSAARGTLISAIRATRGGDQQVTMSVPQQSLQAARGKPLGPGVLSVREAEVLAHVAAARSNRQIAKAMGIAEGTVKRHLRNIFDKLQAVSRIDAVTRPSPPRSFRRRTTCPRRRDRRNRPLRHTFVPTQGSR